MNLKKLLVSFVTVALTQHAIFSFAETQVWPAVTEDGLHLVDNSKMSIVYAEPGADLASYTRVMLTTPEVAFKKNWARDQRSRSVSKLSTSATTNTKKIKKDLAQEFKIVFTETLKEGGYELAAEAAEDVLLIRPAIINLDVKAPEKHGQGRTRNFARSAGEMTLYIELYDSETGDLIAKALDRKIDNPNNAGFYTWTTSSRNKAASQRIIKGWADILVNALNDARRTPEG